MTAFQAKLGSTVSTARRQLGLTQEELAWRADMHRTYLADIERGKRNITMRSVAQLARALQLSVAGLMNHFGGSTGTAGQLDATTLGEVLLVEDNPEDVELTQRAFRQAKIANPLRVVSDGAEALHYLFSTGRHTERMNVNPQLVLLDLNLPKHSGLEVLRQMRANPLTSAIPVVILTISRKDSAILAASRLGVTEYIIKPIDFGGIARVVSRLTLHWALMPPIPGGETTPQP